MKKIIAASALFTATVAGCATPPEDCPRALNPSWQLTPETTDEVRAEVEQGDIIMSWTASALATHSIARGGETIGLIVSDTTRGKVYCDLKVQNVCYEDRDANGSFDHRWKAASNSRAPGELRTVNTPTELTPELAFQEAENKQEVLLTQQLGLLYNGPVEGRADDDFNITNMLGEFMLGWHAGKDAPRDPTGSGWSAERILPTLLLEGVVQEITVNPLGLTYKVVKATVEGDLEIVYRVEAVEDIDLTEKFDYDIERDSETDEDGKPTLEQITTAP
jgi:hypothetical protein